MRSILVKSLTNSSVENEESKLSVADRISMRVFTNLTLFYDYVVPEDGLEKALEKNRGKVS